MWNKEPRPSSSMRWSGCHRYIRDDYRFSRQTAPRRWVNMNALTVISVAALVASGSASLLAYNGVYGGHHGLLGAYPYAGYSGLHPYSYAAPFAPVAPIQSQYHAQDEIGQYSFGYAGGPSSRAETRDAFGVVRGSYNYVDSEGKVQTQHYVADALGFRVSGTNLPVAPDPCNCPSGRPSRSPSRTRPGHPRALRACGSRPRRLLSLRFSYGFSTPLHYAHPTTYASPLHYTAHPPSPPTTPPTSPPPTPRPLDPPSVTPSSSVWSTTPVTPPPTACSTECHELLHSQSLVWTWCVEHSPRSHL
ncbi:hypothetical protein C7M84_023150 [Penaeus vannamei]|uniref:Cuticle protein 6 n=1 Tax=Penaeus vannamei TaxID=6689 RepID=A0A423U4P6_PENVA|nr:hypothetical protein C7M84_023150 [Penaeus vannamei]